MRPLARTPRRAAPALRRRPAHLAVERLGLPDGAATTLYVAEHDPARIALRVARLRRPVPLERWCARRGVEEAMVGGFFVRPDGTPLGELRTRGFVRRSVAFLEPWDEVRAAVCIERGRVTIGRRGALSAAPRGDLLQAGPLLVAGGRAVFADGGEDAEGFSAGQVQFDSDITEGRHPRAALGVRADGTVLAVACDGRVPGEAGLTLGELAGALADRGAEAALNLDGGGSTSLVCDGQLQNVPREGDGAIIPGGRAVSTALLFVPR
jgi:hypothetical protein